MNFSYNLEVKKNTQILIAFVVPLILASICLIVAAYLQEHDPNWHCRNGVCFGPNDYYSTPNLEYIGYCFIAFVMLAIVFPFILFSRNKPIERTELNLK
jgi:hypothetical protein